MYVQLTPCIHGVWKSYFETFRQIHRKTHALTKSFLSKCWDLLFRTILKNTPLQVFSCEFGQFFQYNQSVKHLWATFSQISDLQKTKIFPYLKSAQTLSLTIQHPLSSFWLLSICVSLRRGFTKTDKSKYVYKI